MNNLKCLVQIFHKASPSPTHPSKNTVKLFQSKWNQEKLNTQTPSRPIEFLLTLLRTHRDQVDAQNLCWVRSHLNTTSFAGWECITALLGASSPMASQIHPLCGGCPGTALPRRSKGQESMEDGTYRLHPALIRH